MTEEVRGNKTLAAADILGVNASDVVLSFSATAAVGGGGRRLQSGGVLVTVSLKNFLKGSRDVFAARSLLPAIPRGHDPRRGQTN